MKKKLSMERGYSTKAVFENFKIKLNKFGKLVTIIDRYFLVLFRVEIRINIILDRLI
jgi:hypothetical protein